jgi:hypothetical protein
VHNLIRENTQGAADVHPNTEISGDTKMLLRQPHLKHMVSGDNSSLTPSPVVRQTLKVKFDLTQTTVASLSRRKISSRIRAASNQRLAVEMNVKGEKGRGCTHVHPTSKTGSESRINLIYKSTISFGKELKQLVTISTSLQMENHLPKGHQQMMVRVKDKCI